MSPERNRLWQLAPDPVTHHLLVGGQQHQRRLEQPQPALLLEQARWLPAATYFV